MSSPSKPTDTDPAAAEIPPEQVVSPAVRHQLQKCYEHGQKLLAPEKRDHDYAHTMFTECVVKDPGNLVYVEAFLSNLQEKYKNNKRGGGFLGLGGGSRGEFKKAVAKKQWSDVLRLGPDLLKANPWDVPALRAMAQACEAYHFNEVELRYLKNALDANPKDVEVNRHCAKSLARMGQFDQAIACWHRIEELRKNDTEAPKMISELTLERNRAQAGFGGPPAAARRAGAAAESVAAAPRDTSAEVPAPAKKREIQLTPIQRFEKAISDDPTIVENYLELIDLYVAEQRYADAERVLQRAQAASGGDPDVLARGEDLSIERTRHQLAIAEKRAAAEPGADARQLVEQVRGNLARLELQVFDARSQRFPQDLTLKHRVGECLKKLGNYREAALRFQESRQAPELYVAATLELGECLQHLKQYVKALHCYQRAAEKSAAHPAAVEFHQLALYRGGVLAAGLKEWTTAAQMLGQLADQAPHYKDVQTRLDKVREIVDKS